MEKDTTSFWTEIKKYEDSLAKDPASYCFAPLAELYRRIGLVDDAIAVAQKGAELHPDYVGGHLALGRAYFEKAMIAEARSELEYVTRFTPDNLLAQKLLSQIYIELDETTLAQRALELLLEANPADSESRITLESLQGSSASAPNSVEKLENAPDEWQSESADYQIEVESAVEEDDDAELELIEELYEEVLDDELTGIYATTVDDPAADQADFLEEPFFTTPKEEAVPEVPFKTATMAELYISQGHLQQAINIYSELAGEEPMNAGYAARLSNLQATLVPEAEELPSQVIDDMDDSCESVTAQAATDDIVAWDSASAASGEIGAALEDDAAIAGLEEWLETIRRVRQCRSERA
ncbi:MAG: hypothetical protein KGZ62_01250 [Sulfurimonas sp.]|nr:hypothetical protein [Sulfurimonas sp.]